MNDPRGSIWRQWDLHCHTPASFDYQDMSISNQAIVNNLLGAGITAVAICDHHTMDVARITEVKRLAGSQLTVFPGIELRSELGGGEVVHYIGIFSDDANVADLWTRLQGTLKLTATDITAMGGDERVYVPFRKGATLIKELGGVVTVHAGKKSNSIERIANAEEFKQAVKEDMARHFIDILEIGQANDATGYKTIVFPGIGFERPLLICSDNHNANAYTRTCKCWIKADTTFAGLCQLRNEPSDRVFLGEIPPAMDRVSRNKTKYIQSVSFARSRHRDTAEVWFHDSVAINHELVAIIGNKGGGKSALADVLGLLGNTSHGDCFSFLTAKKFRDPKCNKARCFDATLTWETGSTVTKHLDEEVDPSAVETIRYVPQHYLETICNELGVPGKTAFSKELRAVIFSHVDEADRLGFDSLDAVIEFRTKETDAAIAILKTSLESVIKQYVSLRERASVTHKQTIESQLAQKKLELQAHDETKPIPVTKPDSDPATQQRMEAVAKQIEERAAEVVSFEAEIAALTDGRAKDVKSVSIADKLAGRIENVRVVIEQFRTESAADCEALGLNLDDLVKVTIDLTPLQTRRQRLASDARNKAALLKPENVNSPEFKRLAREKDIASLKTALDEPNRHYQAYLKATKDWQVKHDAMLGDAENVGTIRYYERQLEALAALPQELAQAEGELTALMLRIYREIKKLADVYKGLYRPVQEFIEDHPLARNKFHLGFRADITVVGLEDEFLEMINQGRTGSFCGSDEGRGRLHGIVGRAGFDSEEGVQAFVTEMLKHLRYDLRTDGEPVGIPVKDQLRKGVGEELVYAFLFALGYLKPDYNLSWCGKDVEQLSPGERGTLLLVFYLLIDRSDIPLVVDQPEENLDNQTVYDILVPSIKEAKSRRQIIIVTHNPNLAVVCDADQVIWASLDKEANSSLKYVTGAIENPLINPKVVDILEGTQPAFDNRDAKYRSVTDRGPR